MTKSVDMVPAPLNTSDDILGVFIQSKTLRLGNATDMR